MADSDCIVVMGSNMAENHPVAFRWPMKAKVEHGAKIIHIDPRFTRTSAVADIYAPVRAGSDIAFLGGVINYVINSEKWNKEPFFKSFVVNYTNAATIINEDFKDTEDLNGVFSGLMQSKGGVAEWPFNGFINQYDGATWQYARTKAGAQGQGAAATAQSGETKVSTGPDGTKAPATPATAPASGAKPDGKSAEVPSFVPLVASLVKPPALRDETLQDPRTVFQIVKKHFARYTPEMVEKTTGCPKEMFLKVAETILANSGAERTTSFAYAVAWTQHTYGVQIIGACALLQLLLGNIGRPGAGVMALRGHASIQGSTDIPTLYHSIQGYLAAPTALKKHDTLQDYIAADMKTEVFYLPATQVAELEGTFTNTQRMLQFHHKAAEAPGDCRSDTQFSYDLGKRLKKLYANSTLPRDEGFKNLIWDFEHENEAERKKGEPSALKILKEINGFFTEDPGRHCVGFAELKDDGSTTCASWIYSGVYPGPGKNLADRRTPDPLGQPGAQLQWGWAWPANRRIMYNRASADPEGKPWSEKKKWVWWDAEAKKWAGYDVPDYIATKPPNDKAKPGAAGMDALPGTAPFIMRPDGLGWLFVPAGLVDGPLPTHYEPAESPVKNPLYQQQTSPVLKYWKDAGNPLAAMGDPKYPYIIKIGRAHV